MIEDVMYCKKITRKEVNKELSMSKKDTKDFREAYKCWISGNIHVDDDVRVRDHFHMTGK